jgi:hypothetical protein
MKSILLEISLNLEGESNCELRLPKSENMRKQACTMRGAKCVSSGFQAVQSVTELFEQTSSGAYILP